MSVPLLEIRGLRVSVRQRQGWLPILDDINLSLARDRTLGIVGESGSGKSMLALALTGLLAPRTNFRIEGQVLFEGGDLLRLSSREMRAVRGRGIAMIFQDALNALNPVVSVGRQVEEALRQQRGLSGAEATSAALELFEAVKIPSPKRRLANYPHELSGGMRQRVMIALALACRPTLIIADEPTTSLDVTIQSQILSLLLDLRRAYGMSMIFISHSLGAIGAVADDVAVLYAGQVVEIGSVEKILSHGHHPYTRALLMTTPRIDHVAPLKPIPGTVPRFDALPPGCRFAPRCERRGPQCDTEVPELVAMRPGVGRMVRCVAPIDMD